MVDSKKLVVGVECAISPNYANNDGFSATLMEIKNGDQPDSVFYRFEDCDGDSWDCDLSEIDEILEEVDEDEDDESVEADYMVIVKYYDGTEDEVICSTDDELLARKRFIDTVEARISNFDEYDSSDIEAILDNGREGWGSGEVLLVCNI